MTEQHNSDLKKAIEVWKSNNVHTAYLDFDCGGDSMNDMDISFEDEEGNEIENDELAIYLQDEVFEKVEFYECSDGHYQGESGVVTITLNKSGDGFAYKKDAESEWHEMVPSILTYVLKEEQANLIKSKIQNINGDYDNININFKTDCLLSDNEEKTLNELETELIDYLKSYEPDSSVLYSHDRDASEFSVADYFLFTTNTGSRELTLDDNNGLKILIENQFVIFRENV